MNLRRLTPQLIIAVLLAVFFGVALYLRAYLPYNQVFGSEWIKFTSVDAYYHMRIVDNLVYNFPHLNTFDPYFIYPGGGWLTRIHFFDWLLAGIIWVVGLGSPTQQTIDVIGVYFPAFLGALMVVPVYFIGKELFNHWAGIFAAALIVLLPGEFLGRSILGFTDHHVAETLFSAVTILFLILAVKTARQRRLTLSHIMRRDWAAGARPLLFASLAGVFLGIYLITWIGGLLFVFIIFTYLIIQFIIDHLRRRSTDYLTITGVVLFLVALLIFIPFSPGTLYLVSLIAALLILPVLRVTSWLMASKKIKPLYFPLGLAGIGLAGLAVLYAVSPAMFGAMLGLFSIFDWSGVRTTLEMGPILSPHGSLSLLAVWGNFTTSFFLMFIPLGIVVYQVIKRGNAEITLLLVWSLVILAAILGQRRFAYYFAVNVAVLMGYFSYQFLRFIALLTDWLFNRIESGEFKERMSVSLIGAPAVAREGAGPEKKTRPGKKRRDERYAGKYIFMALAVILVFFVVYFPNYQLAKLTAEQARFAPSDAWQNALTWMKENTPDPFADADFYAEPYEPSPSGEKYDYPESAYGVTAWWDYGYWITRIAHRLPNANPGQDPDSIRDIANLFLDQAASPDEEIIRKLKSSYVVLDSTTTGSKFWAIITWAGKEVTEYQDTYILDYQGKLMRVNLFYPEYYRTFITRLYNFDGQAVTSVKPVVISYEEKFTPKNEPYRQITKIKNFTSYEAALDYIEEQGTADNIIIGTNPFVSPVPLEPVRGYELVYTSDDAVLQPDVGLVPEVKIFEYTGQ